MVILLPKDVNGLAAFERSLTADRLNKLLGALKPTDVDVSLPRFKVTAEFQLKDALSSMGMTDAFRDGVADLSGMDGRKKLFISRIVHKAFVDVNEEGTEAAAATGVVVKAISAPPSFDADHPFVFLIREKRTGAILFLGRLADPTG
jgi:serpin B